MMGVGDGVKIPSSAGGFGGGGIGGGRQVPIKINGAKISEYSFYLFVFVLPVVCGHDI